MALKQFLMQRGLNERHPRADVRSENANLGALLIEFFELYGRHFNYAKNGISVKGAGALLCKEAVYQTGEYNPSILFIEDPLNKGNDIGRSSYGALQVKQAFEYAFLVLSQATHRNNPQYFDIKLSILGKIVHVSDDVVSYRSWCRDNFPVIIPPLVLPLPSHLPPPAPIAALAAMGIDERSLSPTIVPLVKDLIAGVSANTPCSCASCMAGGGLVMVQAFSQPEVKLLNGHDREQVNVSVVEANEQRCLVSTTTCCNSDDGIKQAPYTTTSEGRRSGKLFGSDSGTEDLSVNSVTGEQSSGRSSVSSSSVVETTSSSCAGSSSSSISSDTDSDGHHEPRSPNNTQCHHPTPNAVSSDSGERVTPNTKLIVPRLDVDTPQLSPSISKLSPRRQAADQIMRKLGKNRRFTTAAHRMIGHALQQVIPMPEVEPRTRVQSQKKPRGTKAERWPTIGGAAPEGGVQPAVMMNFASAARNGTNKPAGETDSR